MLKRRQFLQGLSAAFMSTWTKLSEAQYIPQAFWRKHTSTSPTGYTLWVWGYNLSGVVGDNTVVSKSSPTQVGDVSAWSTIVSGGITHTAARNRFGTLWVWGSNASTVLGDNTGVSKSSPNQVGALTSWTKVRGSNFVVALRSDGSLWNWGNSAGMGVNTNLSYSSPVQVGTLTTWSDIFESSGSPFVKRSDGTVWTWGTNSSGQLGIGLTTNRSSPTQLGTLTTWSQISGNNLHRLGLRTDGTLWGWGLSTSGRIGLGPTVTAPQSSPVQVGTLTTWSKIAAGGTHSLAIRSDGTLWAWGLGSSGQLGLNHMEFTQTARDFAWSQVVNESQGTLAIRSDGTLWVTGDGTSGQLGTGATIGYSSPTQIGTLTTWAELTSNSFTTHAIRSDGTLWGWGASIKGKLGNNSSDAFSSPVQIGSLTTWSKVSGGETHTIALRTDGTMWGWGLYSLNQYDISFNPNGGMNQVGTLTTWSSINGGGKDTSNYKTTFAVRNDGTLWSWGADHFGALGRTTNANHLSSPGQVGALTTWSKVDIGGLNGHGIRTDGTLWSWGNEALGNNATTFQSSPVQVGLLNTWSTLAAGVGICAAIRTDNTLWVWGENNLSGQFGINTTTGRSSPVQVGTDAVWSKVSAGSCHTVGIKTDGTLWAWGNNSNGRLGVSSTTSYSSPVQVGALTTWQDVASGFNATIALRTDGTLWTWGVGAQLGHGLTTDRSSPIQIGSAFTWSNIGTWTNSAAIRSDGTLWSWGVNSTYQLGVGDNVARSSMTQVGTANDWAEVSPGIDYIIARKTDGTIWTAGGNDSGQLGNGSTSTSNYFHSPILISGSTTWAKIEAGCTHNLALRTDGTLWSWGASATGQTGWGITTSNKSPTQIGTLTTWTKISTKFDNSYAIRSDNTLWSWGSQHNGSIYSGLLGINSGTHRSSPVQIGTLTQWAHVSAGFNACYAIRTDGTLWGWGGNYNLGFGDTSVTTSGYSSPIQLGSMTTWANLTCKPGDHMFALQSDGSMWATIGAGNSWAQAMCGYVLGYREFSPIQVGTLTTWTEVAAGLTHSLARRSDGTLWAWGFNTSGLLGVGSTIIRHSPVQVGNLTTWVKIGAGSSHSIGVTS